jgi:hypothetical protein
VKTRGQTPIVTLDHVVEEASALSARDHARRSLHRASTAIVVLVEVVSAFGLFTDVYRDNTLARAGFRGSDLISFALAAPLLAIFAAGMRRGSPRGRLLWLGTLGYIAYTYAYTFAIAWNPLFPLYVAILSLTGFTLARGLITTDADEMTMSFSSRTPTRGISTYFWLIGGLLLCLWTAQIVPALIAGDVPKPVVDFGGRTGIVYILDLGVIVPLFFLAGRWLRARRPWGFVLAAIMLVKGVAEGLSLLSGTAFAYADGANVDAQLIPFYAVIALGSFWLLIRYMRSVDRASS